MSKLATAGKMANEYRRSDIFRVLTEIDRQVNALAECRIGAFLNADTAAPSSSATPFAQGDKVWNTTPSEQGTAGSKYVVVGWVCVASGTPGTWKDMRVLTGS